MSISRNLKNRLIPYLVIMIFAILVSACTEDDLDPDDSTNPPVTIERTLTGTAATGAAVEGTVTILDADGGSLTTQSDASGTYSVNLEGRPGPYLIRFVPNDNNLPVLYSYASNSGVANITQFTSLALVLAYQNLADAFANWTTILSSWDRAALEQALARINANFFNELQTAGVEPKTYDLFTAPFDADQTGIDAFLDNYTITFNYSIYDYTITDKNSGQSVTFNEDITIDGYYIGAWFIPDGTDVWELTITFTIDGDQQTLGPMQLQTEDIPWSRERYNELFWDTFPESSTETLNCDDDPEITNCDITVQISKLDTSYNITGNGGLGTQIDASFAYSWSVTGTVQGISGGAPFSQDIDESYSWSYAWRWQRVE